MSSTTSGPALLAIVLGATSLLGQLLSMLPDGAGPWIFQVSNVAVRSTLVADARVPEDGYASTLDAVLAASNRFNPDSIALNREHVGAVLKCAGAGYFYTHGVGAPGQAPVTYSIARPARCRIAALWHTHGAEASDRHLFSPEDTAAANAIDRPIYMTNHTGRLYVFKPGGRTFGNRKSSRFGAMPMPRGAAEGSVLSDPSGAAIRIRTEEAVPSQPDPLLLAALQAGDD